MPNNTKARSNFLRSIAEEIIIREKLDLENPPLDKRAYIREIAERGDCHIETARTVFNSVFGAMRWGYPVEAYASWGGAGRGQGRKPTKRAPDAVRCPECKSRNIINDGFVIVCLSCGSHTADWYNKLARYCEDTPALGSIQYKQIELLAEYIAKIEAAQQPACTCGGVLPNQ